MYVCNVMYIMIYLFIVIYIYGIIEISVSSIENIMAPVPLEGHQTPITNNIPQEGNRGGTITLGLLIDFIIQRTYHELTVLAEL